MSVAPLPAIRESTPALVIRDREHYLAIVAEVRDLAERIEHVGEARDLADRARAAQVWAQRAKLGQEQVNLASIAKLWAERRAGELLAADETIRPGNPSGREGFKLADIGVTHGESHRWQELAEVPAEEFQAAIDAAATDGHVSRAKVMAVHYSSETGEWATPQDLFDLLAVEFAFTLDVCATADNAKCDRYFTEDDDGLAQDWTGVCWMNPPYGDAIRKWVQKAWEASQTGTTVVCLVPARVDTGWWWDYCRYGEVRFLRGRLKFGGGETSAPFPSAIVVFPREPHVVWWER